LSFREGDEWAYLWHSRLTLKSSPHTIINTLWLSPAWINTFESITLVAVEAFGVYIGARQSVNFPTGKKFTKIDQNGGRWGESKRASFLCQEDETYASLR
jgi:hypothetical protein